MTNPVVHFEIGGRDTDRLSGFYDALFGWTIRTSAPGYALIDKEDGGIGGGILQLRGDMPPYVTVYVQVDDLRASLERVVDLGGHELVAPTPIPGVGEFALIGDPDGNIVRLLHVASAEAMSEAQYPRTDAGIGEFR